MILVDTNVFVDLWTRAAPLPDFFIGAHAEAEGLTHLTRDAARYRTYFPQVSLIAPPQRKRAD